MLATCAVVLGLVECKDIRLQHTCAAMVARGACTVSRGCKRSCGQCSAGNLSSAAASAAPAVQPVMRRHDARAGAEGSSHDYLDSRVTVRPTREPGASSCPPCVVREQPAQYSARARLLAQLAAGGGGARRRAASALSECANLAPAGTGTRPLTAWLRKHSKLAHHLHTARYMHLKAAKCVILTIRDPWARLISGFNFERDARTHNPHTFARAGYRSAEAFVDALTRSDHERLPASALYYSSLRGVYRNISTPRYVQPFSYNTIRGGEHHLVPQIDYVDDAMFSTVDIHFLCTESLDSDLAELSSTFEPAPGGGVPDIQRMSAVPSRVVKHQRHRANLTSCHAKYVRECLYPADAWLWEHICVSHSLPKHLYAGVWPRKSFGDGAITSRRTGR